MATHNRRFFNCVELLSHHLENPLIVILLLYICLAVSERASVLDGIHLMQQGVGGGWLVPTLPPSLRAAKISWWKSRDGLLVDINRIINEVSKHHY